MGNAVESYKLLNGRTISIFQDTYPQNPREDHDNAGTMVFAHRRYRIGDIQGDGTVESVAVSVLETIDEEMAYCRARIDLGLQEKSGIHNANWQRALKEKMFLASSLGKGYEAIMKAVERVAIVIPVWMYEHSGIAIQTKPFSDAFDSGLLGYIFITRARARREWGGETGILSAKRLAQARDCLEAEVVEYDQYLTGDVYLWSMETEETAGDSCGGYFGLDAVRQGAYDSLSDGEQKELREKWPRINWTGRREE